MASSNMAMAYLAMGMAGKCRYNNFSHYSGCNAVAKCETFCSQLASVCVNILGLTWKLNLALIQMKLAFGRGGDVFLWVQNVHVLQWHSFWFHWYNFSFCKQRNTNLNVATFISTCNSHDINMCVCCQNSKFLAGYAFLAVLTISFRVRAFVQVFIKFVKTLNVITTMLLQSSHSISVWQNLRQS